MLFRDELGKIRGFPTFDADGFTIKEVLGVLQPDENNPENNVLVTPSNLLLNIFLDLVNVTR